MLAVHVLYTVSCAHVSYVVAYSDCVVPVVHCSGLLLCHVSHQLIVSCCQQQLEQFYDMFS